MISAEAAGATTPMSGSNGNSAAAHECQKGGYINYATMSGTTFSNTGACVSYAAQGGTLVALPDLVVVPSCTSAPGSESCTFMVKNIGLGPATGNLELDATFTAPYSLSLERFTTAVAECPPDGHGVASATGTPTGGTAAVSCTYTLPPGATTPFLFVQFDAGTASGQSLTFTAVVNPNHTIAESNYANNSFSQTIVIP